MSRSAPWLLAAGLAAGMACSRPPAPSVGTSSYFDNTGRDDVISGGVKLVPMTTPKGRFHVWTKRVGNNPTRRTIFRASSDSC